MLLLYFPIDIDKQLPKDKTWSCDVESVYFFIDSSFYWDCHDLGKPSCKKTDIVWTGMSANTEIFGLTPDSFQLDSSSVTTLFLTSSCLSLGVMADGSFCKVFTIIINIKWHHETHNFFKHFSTNLTALKEKRKQLKKFKTNQSTRTWKNVKKRRNKKQFWTNLAD